MFLTRFQFSDVGGNLVTVSGRGTKRNSTETVCARWEINMRERVVVCFGDIVK